MTIVVWSSYEMPAPKGHERYGGRQKGTPNKRTLELVELIQARFPNYDPILSLVEIAQDRAVPVDLRIRCHAEVAG
jgi:hypothetical protein